jgi:hypothetical protein
MGCRYQWGGMNLSVSVGDIPLIVRFAIASLEESKGTAAVAFFLFGSFSFFTIACGNVGNSRGSSRRAGLRMNSPTT